MEDLISIKENVQAEIVVKKSRFICNLEIATSKKEAEEIIKRTKKGYHDARHNCVAYRIISDDKIIEKSSDDGEPSGTAGGPMLNILQKNNLCNVVAIVTRYFGGILLGTGGLVKSYSDSLLEAISKSEIVEKCSGEEYEVKIEYNYLEIFKHYCKTNDIFIISSQYSDIIICKIELDQKNKKKLLDDFETKKVKLIDLKFLSKKIINKSIIK